MTSARLHSKLLREDLQTMDTPEVFQFLNKFNPVEIVEVEAEEEKEEEKKEKKPDKGWIQHPWKTTVATKDAKWAKAYEVDAEWAKAYEVDDAKPSGSKDQEVAMGENKPKVLTLKPKVKKMPKRSVETQTPKPPVGPPPKKPPVPSPERPPSSGSKDGDAMKQIMDKACCFPFVECFPATIDHGCSSLNANFVNDIAKS